MISLCDGCGHNFGGVLEEINAKKWKPSLCDVPHEDSEFCSNIECDYNINAECCVGFQFCKKCFSNKQLVDANFVNFI
jgi:hypothetical protein